MINAKEEFLQAVGTKTVECVHLHNEAWWQQEVKHLVLPVGYSQQEYETFLTCLDVAYDNGYGSQCLFGYIWFTDGTWAERGEYDGSEWWSVKERPPYPDMLLQRGQLPLF